MHLFRQHKLAFKEAVNARDLHRYNTFKPTLVDNEVSSGCSCRSPIGANRHCGSLDSNAAIMLWCFAPRALVFVTCQEEKGEWRQEHQK